jgi:hypothetical protein
VRKDFQARIDVSPTSPDIVQTTGNNQASNVYVHDNSFEACSVGLNTTYGSYRYNSVYYWNNRPPNSLGQQFSYTPVGFSSVAAQNLSPNLQANFNSGTAYTLYQTVAARQHKFSAALTVVNASNGSTPNLNLYYTDIGGVARTVQCFSSLAANANINLYYSAPLYCSANSNVNVQTVNYAPGSGNLAYSLGMSVEVM